MLSLPLNLILLLIILLPVITLHSATITAAESCNQDNEDSYDQIPHELDMDLRLLKHFVFARNPDGTTKGLLNGGSIEDYISERFNKTLDGCDTEFKIVQVEDIKYHWNHAFNVTMKLKSGQSKLLENQNKVKQADNLGLLRGLNNIVNCSLGCDSRYDESVDTFYDYFIASDKMMDLWLDVKIFINQIKIKHAKPATILNDTTSTTSRNFTMKCKLCDQISQAIDEHSNRSSMIDFGHIFRKLIAMANSIMDPNHWIALVVGIWLMTCCAVAIYRKKHDKRHLPEYLKQRENYSFSAKRNPNSANT